MRFLIRLLVTALALWVAVAVIGGITLQSDAFWKRALTLLAVAVIFGLVNAVLKPIIHVVGCVFYVLTLGLFALVVNALLFWLTSWLAGVLRLPFHVNGFWAAFWGAIIVSLVSWAISLFVPDRWERAPV